MIKEIVYTITLLMTLVFNNRLFVINSINRVDTMPNSRFFLKETRNSLKVRGMIFFICIFHPIHNIINPKTPCPQAIISVEKQAVMKTMGTVIKIRTMV